MSYISIGIYILKLKISYLSRYGRRFILVPLQSLRGEVGLGGLLHLGHGAVDVLVIEVLLEPVVLIPPDEEPDVLWTIETLKMR